MLLKIFFFKFKIGQKLNAFFHFFRKKYLQCSFNVLCVCKIENALNLTGITLERIHVFILFAVENDCPAVEVVAG